MSFQINITFPQTCHFLYFEVHVLKPRQIRVLYYRIRIKKLFEASNFCLNEETRQFSSNLEPEYMLMHIMRVGLKGSNFQGWPISLLVSSVA